MTVPNAPGPQARRGSVGRLEAMFTEPREGATLLSLLNAGLRHRHALAAGMLGGFAIAVGVTLAQPRTFTSQASFMPGPGRSSEAARLSGLAGQLGLSVGGLVQPTQTPYFFVDLLQSREILGAAVDSTYEILVDSGVVRSNLIEILPSEGSTPVERREHAIRELRERVTTSVLLKSGGMIVLDVKTIDASLSQQIAVRLLALLDRFNQENRQSQASSERRFVEARLADRRSELQQSEARLREFLEENREYRNSPRLMFEYDRLEREVVMRQQLVTSLAQSYEQARIDEVRDTPVIAVTQQPDLPVVRDRRHLISKALVGLLVGALVGLGLARGREFLAAASRSDSPEAVELTRLLKTAVGEMRHPVRSLRRQGARAEDNGE